MSVITTRFAKQDDEHKIKTLLAECQLPTQDLGKLDLLHFQTAWFEGELIGVAGLEIFGEIALLRSLVVHGHHRNQGVASDLIQRIEIYAQQQKIRQLYLLTTTAEAFFSQRGYGHIDRKNLPEAIAATEEFHSLCPDSAVCMYKMLDVR